MNECTHCSIDGIWGWSRRTNPGEHGMLVLATRIVAFSLSAASSFALFSSSLLVFASRS